MGDELPASDPAMASVSVQIDLLGSFAVRVDGEERAGAWPGRRSAELVQLLALMPGHQLLRDQVIDALWPHLDAQAGAANLRKAAHQARLALRDPEAVVLRGGHVQLFPERTVDTDAQRFAALADAALDRSDASAARIAADAYRGDLLPSAIYEDWSTSARDQLRDRYLAVLGLAGVWGRLAELDPTDEHAAREVMRAALAAGNRHAAITRYGRLRSALSRELGVLPDAETEELYAACGAGVGLGLGGAREAVFVGRGEELAVIGSRLRRSAGAGASAFAVHGPAGIGKSALCRQVERLARAEGWRVLSVTADDPVHTYAALATLIEQVVVADRVVLDLLDAKARSVLALVSPLMAPAEGLEMPLTRHQVIGAAQRVLDAAAPVPGTLVVVDDAHLADDASIEAALRLGDSGARDVVVLCAYRREAAPEALRRHLACLARAGAAEEMELAPLDREEVGLLASAVGDDVSAAAIDAIAARSEGNPFFVIELLRNDAGASLREAVAARFVDLDDAQQAMLRRLALVGGDLDLLTVLALTGATERDAGELLDAALDAGVLVVDEGRYRYRHDLVRSALADQMPPHQRVAVHRDAARRLAEAGAAPSLVARHWLDGGRPAEAAPWLIAGARDALRLASYTTVLSQVELLLRHDPVNPEALLLRAKAYDALADPRALASYAAAAHVVGEPEASEIRPLQALAQIKQGDPAGALTTLAGPEPVTLEARLAHALTLSGAAALGFGDPAIGSAKAAEVRRLAFASGDTEAVVVASWAQAAAAHARGDLRGSLRADLLDTQGLAKLAVNVFDGQLCFAQRLLYGSRPYPEVIEFMDSFAAEASRLGAARGYAFAVTLRGEARLLAGALDAADADLEEGCRLHRAIGGCTGESFSMQRRAEVAWARGARREARVLLDDALAIARESDVGFHLLDRIYGTRLMMGAETDADAAAAALEEAEESVRGPVETCPGCRITFAFPAALASARAGDLERLEHYEGACDFLAGVVMRLPAWYAALDEVRGHRALLVGDAHRAATHFAAAAEVYAAVGQPLDRARCEVSAARGSG